MIEAPGQGVTGEVEGRAVTVGGWSLRREPRSRRPSRRSARLLAGEPEARRSAPTSRSMAGARASIEYADRLRPELAGFSPAPPARASGASCCSRATTRPTRPRWPRAVGIDEAHGDLLPEDKVALRAAAGEGRASGC